jgi:sugar phosphate isomerase/epimerase
LARVKCKRRGAKSQKNKNRKIAHKTKEKLHPGFSTAILRYAPNSGGVLFMSGISTQWSIEEINARLGISSAVFREPIGEKHISQIREAGITRIEFSINHKRVDYHNATQVSTLKNACKHHGVRVVSVHGPFDLPYLSEDESDQKHVIEESLCAIRFSAEMGASIYVAHFGYHDHSKKIVTELLNQTQDLDICMTTENQTRQPLDLYMKVVDEVASSRFGMIVDIGHTRDSDGINPFVKRDVARKTIADCGDRVFHVHLHETFNLDKQPDHRPPMHKDGIIEWGEVFLGLKDIGYTGELIFEDGRGEDPEDWIRHTADFPKTFMQKYGHRQHG